MKANVGANEISDRCEDVIRQHQLSYRFAQLVGKLDPPDPRDVRTVAVFKVQPVVGRRQFPRFFPESRDVFNNSAERVRRNPVLQDEIALIPIEFDLRRR